MSNDNMHTFNIHGYTNISTYCRQNLIHGGVCIFTNNSQKAEIIPELCAATVEGVCEIAAVLMPMLNTIVLCTYRPPNGDLQLFLEIIESVLQWIVVEKQDTTRIVLAGDFNIDLMRRTNAADSWTNLLLGFDLRPTIHSPTRTCAVSATCVDNIMVNFSSEGYSAYVSRVGLSDHDAQVLLIETERTKTRQRQITKDILNRTTLADFSEQLALESFEDVYRLESPNDKFSCFMNIVLRVKSATIPSKSFTPSRSAIPYHPGLRDMKETPNLIHDSYRQRGNIADKILYDQYKKGYLLQVEKHKREHHMQMVNRASNR